MRISELTKRQQLILEIETANKTYPLSVKIYENTPQALYLEAITSGGKYLGLGNRGVFHGAKYNLLLVSDDQRLEWMSVDLETHPYKNKICYKITTRLFNAEAKNVTRRTDTRISVKKMSNCIFGKLSFPVQIENFSLNGLAFSDTQDMGLVNNRIIIRIQDRVNREDYDLTLYCRCIRKSEFDDENGLHRYL